MLEATFRNIVDMEAIHNFSDIYRSSLCIDSCHPRKHADTALEQYVTQTLTDIITTFFKSPFSDQSTTVQTRQSVFVQVRFSVKILQFS